MRNRFDLLIIKNKIVEEGMKKFHKYEDMKNHCFFCGERMSSSTKEHYISKWLLAEEGVLNEKKFLRDSDKTIEYAKGTLPSCENCNSVLMAKVEEKFKEGGISFKTREATGAIGDDLITAGFAKTAAGIELEEARRSGGHVINKNYFEGIALGQMHFKYNLRDVGRITGSISFEASNQPEKFTILNNDKALMLLTENQTFIFSNSMNRIHELKKISGKEITYFKSISIFNGISGINSNKNTMMIAIDSETKELQELFSVLGIDYMRENTNFKFDKYNNIFKYSKKAITEDYDKEYNGLKELDGKKIMDHFILKVTRNEMVNMNDSIHSKKPLEDFMAKHFGVE